LPNPFTPIAPKFRDEIPAWLEQWKFDRFVTLATNRANMPGREFGSHDERLTGLVKEWDGRMNRKLAGPKWAKRRKVRLWAFYFLEKPKANPLRRGLIRLTPPPGMLEMQRVTATCEISQKGTFLTDVLPSPASPRSRRERFLETHSRFPPFKSSRRRRVSSGGAVRFSALQSWFDRRDHACRARRVARIAAENMAGRS